MMKNDKTIALEDLLKLKRSEMPDDGFWQTFDAELNNRMLNEIVGKSRVSTADILSYLMRKAFKLATASMACAAVAIAGYFALSKGQESTFFANRFVALNSSCDRVELSNGMLTTTNNSLVKCAKSDLLSTYTISSNSDFSGKLLAL